MTRWLQAAKSAQGLSDTNDKNDFIPLRPISCSGIESTETVFLSFKSFVSGGGKTDFGGSESAQPSPSQHNPETLKMEFEERAAILEFDAGFSRQEAERRAHLEIYGRTVGKGENQ